MEDGRGDGEYYDKRVQLDCGKSPYPCVENGKSGPDHGLGERVRRDRPHSDGCINPILDGQSTEPLGCGVRSGLDAGHRLSTGTQERPLLTADGGSSLQLQRLLDWWKDS